MAKKNEPGLAENDLVQEKDGTVSVVVSVVETVGEQTATIQPLFRMEGDVPKRMGGVVPPRDVALVTLKPFSY